jgi:hypothetical protein
MWSFEWKQICAGILLLVYICIAIGDAISRERKVGIPLFG